MTSPSPDIPKAAWEAREVLVLRNPRSGTGHGPEKIRALVDELGKRGLRAIVHSDQQEFSAAVRAGVAENRLRAVVSAGGDGTAEFVVSQIPPDLPMAVFPLGTENLLAKYLGWTTDARRVAESIELRRIQQLDAAIVATPDGSQRLFLLMLGCGFDAAVVERLHAYRTGPISHWSYVKPILESVRAYKYPKLTVNCYDAEGRALAEPQDARWAFVFNFPFYALGLGICSDADPRDGTLDVITFPGRTLWNGLYNLVAVLLGRHRQLRGVEVVRASRLRIAAEHPVPIQLDGDPAGHLPVEVRVLPKHWTAVVPGDRAGKDSAGSLPSERMEKR